MGLCMFSMLLCGPRDMFAWSLCHHAGEIQRTPICTWLNQDATERPSVKASKHHIRLTLATAAVLQGQGLLDASPMTGGGDRSESPGTNAGERIQLQGRSNASYPAASQQGWAVYWATGLEQALTTTSRLTARRE